MRKQSKMHLRSRSIETETAATTFPIPARTETQPKGLFARDRFKPTHLNTGAAESHTEPVEMPHHANTASTSTGQPNIGGSKRPDTSAGSDSSKTQPH
jgi:hypothetical protein